LSGGLNLAVVATANAASLTMAAIILAVGGKEGAEQQVLAVIAGAGAGLVVAMVIGTLTGWLVSALKLHPMLVTIGTMSTISGLSVLLTRGGVISGFPPVLLALSNQLVVGVPLSFILAVIVFGCTGFLLSKTAFGVSVRMLGSNPEATAFSGISATSTLVGTYVLSSVLCWVAALVMMSRFNSASAAYGESYLLVTILAAVLGGIDPFGGFGRITSLFLALLILQFVSTGFNVLGFDQHLINAIWGIMLIIVVAGRAGRVWRRSGVTRQRA
jgi:simple sugar transport system permease protein